MRFRFGLVPLGVVSALAASPAVAETYLTLEQAQQLIFPGAKFTPADITLSNAQVNQLERVSQATVFRNSVKLWRASTGGWFFLDQVPGRDDRITYAVGINPDGTVKGVEVLVCVHGYDQVRGAWRRQFFGKKHHNAHLSREVSSISGTTLSAAHLTDGITRLLATYELFVAPTQG